MKRFLLALVLSSSLLPLASVAVAAESTTTVLKADIPSPRKETTGKLGDATITVNYGSPSVKGRKVFGGLEPFGKVWRAGANEATTFTTSTDLKVAGESLPAGTYGFFIEPMAEGAWTVIFNAVAKQWGAYRYDASEDVLRVKVVPETAGSPSETLEYTIENSALVMHWADVKLVVPLAAK